jgi:hypothetical protein
MLTFSLLVFIKGIKGEEERGGEIYFNYVTEY